MSCQLIQGLVVAGLFCSLAGAEEGFVPLCDGKSLQGWTVKCQPRDRDLARKFWRVTDGVIVADSLGHKNHDYVWLVSDQEYADFVLRLRFLVGRGIKGNSGVQFRSRYDDEAGHMDGPQIDINPAGPWRTGMIWDETRGGRGWLFPRVAKGQGVDESLAPKGFKFFLADEGQGWNDLEISALGMKIQARLNGVVVTDYDGGGVLDDAIHQQRRVGRLGVIALQLHARDELRLGFKDIRIKKVR